MDSFQGFIILSIAKIMNDVLKINVLNQQSNVHMIVIYKFLRAGKPLNLATVHLKFKQKKLKSFPQKIQFKIQDKSFERNFILKLGQVALLGLLQKS